MCEADVEYSCCAAKAMVILAQGRQAGQSVSENHYLACEGGHDLLRYVIRNASISPLVVADWDCQAGASCDCSVHNHLSLCVGFHCLVPGGGRTITNLPAGANSWA